MSAYKEAVQKQRSNQTQRALNDLSSLLCTPLDKRFTKTLNAQALDPMNRSIYMLDSVFLLFPDGWLSVYAGNDVEFLTVFCAGYFSKERDLKWEADVRELKTFLDVLHKQWNTVKDAFDLKELTKGEVRSGLIKTLLTPPQKAFTEYPLFPDEFGREAPIREVKPLAYDGDKYVYVAFEGAQYSFKAGYLYSKPFRLTSGSEKVPLFPIETLPVVDKPWDAFPNAKQV